MHLDPKREQGAFQGQHAVQAPVFLGLGKIDKAPIVFQRRAVGLQTEGGGVLVLAAGQAGGHILQYVEGIAGTVPACAVQAVAIKALLINGTAKAIGKGHHPSGFGVDVGKIGVLYDLLHNKPSEFSHYLYFNVKIFMLL